MKIQVRAIVGVLCLIFCLGGAVGASGASGKIQVDDAESLKKYLRATGKATIVITDDISVKETLVCQGEKILIGDGGRIKRAFGGTIIKVKNGSLSLRSIKLDGSGVSGSKLYGYLVDVSGGQLALREGASLVSNRNSSSASDGGGAVRVRSGATFVMNGGSISDNTSVTGGAGVRVDSGGSFYMKGGSISDNTCAGKSSVDGFEGRGGAIYNCGTTVITGGSISSNKASAYTSSGRHYGGVGGAICNRGICQISGGSITSNSSTVSGGGIYSLAGTVKLLGGTISSNHSEDGDDIGYYGGSVVCDGRISIGEIWLRSGRVLKLGGGFSSGSKIKIYIDKLKDGTKISDGSGINTGKKLFVLGGVADKKDYSLVASGGVLKIKKKKSVSPTPYKNRGSVRIHTSATPSPTYRPRPTYRAVATLDPRGLISTAVPRSSPSASASVRPSAMSSMLPISSVSPSTNVSLVPSASPVLGASPLPSVSPRPSLNPSTSPSYGVSPESDSDRSNTLGVTVYRFSSSDLKALKTDETVLCDDVDIDWVRRFYDVIDKFRTGGVR